MIAQTQQKKSVLRVGVHAVAVLFFMLLVLIVLSIMQGCGQARITTTIKIQPIPSVAIVLGQQRLMAPSMAAVLFHSPSWIPSYSFLALLELSSEADGVKMASKSLQHSARHFWSRK
ncbi:MAG: hypothetical protein WAM91_08025 [Candidatus Acidiferrales bacterium]